MGGVAIISGYLVVKHLVQAPTALEDLIVWPTPPPHTTPLGAELDQILGNVSRCRTAELWPWNP